MEHLVGVQNSRPQQRRIAMIWVGALFGWRPGPIQQVRSLAFATWRQGLSAGAGAVKPSAKAQRRPRVRNARRRRNRDLDAGLCAPSRPPREATLLRGHQPPRMGDVAREQPARRNACRPSRGPGVHPAPAQHPDVGCRHPDSGAEVPRNGVRSSRARSQPQNQRDRP
jgi:hypothetical protein